MIEITPTLFIDENEIQLDFIRSSGPGGQNVNKVATGVQLRFPMDASFSLTEDVKLELHRIARNRITTEGVLIIEAKRFRTQEQNREDAIQRLVSLLQKALEKPKIRKATRPSAAARAARVDEKKKRSQVKKLRGEKKRLRGAGPAAWE